MYRSEILSSVQFVVRHFQASEIATVTPKLTPMSENLYAKYAGKNLQGDRRSRCISTDIRG